jgi:hypothetical protein
MHDKSDPTKDPEFQKVIRHFVTTPPTPHKGNSPSKAKSRPQKKGRAKNASRATSRNA